MKFIVLFLLLVSVLRAVNGLTVGALTLTPNFVSCGFIAAYSGDDNANATCTVEYKPVSSGTWLPTFATFVIIDRRTVIITNDSTGTEANPYLKQARVCFAYLQRNTTYDVRILWTDPDGVTGTNPVTGTFTTWSHDVPVVSAGNTYYIDATGNDTTGSGTLVAPWATPAKAAGVAVPGDRVLVITSCVGGTFGTAGTAGNYIEFTSVNPLSPATITTDLTITGAYTYFHHIITGNVFDSGARYLNFSYNNVTNGQFRFNAADNTGYLIEHCAVAFSTQQTTDTAGTGIYQKQGATGGGTIRYNTFDKVWDGIGGEGNFDRTAGFRDAEIYENIVTHASDDCFELDGSCLGLRVWNNTGSLKPTSGFGTGGRVGLSYGGCVVGPAYLWNNVFFGLDYGCKIGRGDAKVFNFNSDFWATAEETVAAQAGGEPTNQWYSNNVYQALNSKAVFDMLAWPGTGWYVNYNNWDSGGSIRVKWNGTDASGFTNCKAAMGGSEANGRSVASAFTDAATGDFTLLVTSGLIDVGQEITGFGFDKAGRVRPAGAWDIGAYEFGAASAGGSTVLGKSSLLGKIKTQ